MKNLPAQKRTTKPPKPLPKIPPDGLLSGAVCAQYKRCGKANCRCARGQLHGPYYYRFKWHSGRVIKKYIPLAQVEEVFAACARHRAVQADRRASNERFTSLLIQLQTKIKELGL